MPKIRAAVCHEFGKPLVLEEVMLREPAAGELEVTIRACAICHSDISAMDGDWGGHLPAVYGHEAAGVITGIGADVSTYKIGDTVLVTLIRSCGHCVSCCSGKPTCCETRYDTVSGPLKTIDGKPMEQGLATGAFAEKVVVDQSQIQHIPENISMTSASLLACGVITGIGAVTNTAKVTAGSTVAVIGAGGVGLNAIQGSVISGASKIIAIDVTEEKLKVAKEFGATDVVLTSDDKPHRIVKKMTGGRGVDYVFVTVGSIPAYESASRFLNVGGKVVMVGMPPSGAKIAIEPVILASTSQSFLGSYMGSAVLKKDIPYLIDLYKQGRLKLDELVTRTYPLSEIHEELQDDKAGNTLRNVINLY